MTRYYKGCSNERYTFTEYEELEYGLLDNETGKVLGGEEILDLLNQLSKENEQLRQSRDYWCKSAKLHSEYFDCLEKAIEIAYEEKPYPKIEDIMTIYSKLEKEINDE